MSLIKKNIINANFEKLHTQNYRTDFIENHPVFYLGHKANLEN